MLRQTSLILALVLSTSLVLAKKSSSPSEAELAGITARGQMLAEYDIAAWHATDAVRAMHPAQGSVARYVARKTQYGWVVAFGRFNEKHDRFLVVYEATQGANPEEFTVKQYDAPQEDAGFYYSAGKAIGTALGDFRGEKRPYNVAVLPAESNQMYVYIVPAQTTAGVYPLGGDVRYLISPDGSTIVDKRQLHKAILEFRTSGGPLRTEGGYHTHVLSDAPEDTDVFYVLTRKPSVPEYLGTKTHVYVIRVDGTIVREK